MGVCGVSVQGGGGDEVMRVASANDGSEGCKVCSVLCLTWCRDRTPAVGGACSGCSFLHVVFTLLHIM